MNMRIHTHTRALRNDNQAKTNTSCFEAAYTAFLKCHIRYATTDLRKRKLQEGLSHSSKVFLEKVWWPLFGNFDNLYPEYHLVDYQDGNRFIDFAYIEGPILLAIEVDDYSTHCKVITREQHSDSLTRQNHIMLDGWRILRFSLDDAMNYPRKCQQQIQQFLGRFKGMISEQAASLTLEEREILRYMHNVQRSVSPIEMAERLGVGQRKARELLRALVQDRQLLKPSGLGRRIIRYYELARSVDDWIY